MKRLAYLLVTTLMALSLSACATMQKEEGTARVKCPACGYVFTSPMGGA
jgi:hypothetical protein